MIFNHLCNVISIETPFVNILDISKLKIVLIELSKASLSLNIPKQIVERIFRRLRSITVKVPFTRRDTNISRTIVNKLFD